MVTAITLTPITKELIRWFNNIKHPSRISFQVTSKITRSQKFSICQPRIKITDSFPKTARRPVNSFSTQTSLVEAALRT